MGLSFDHEHNRHHDLCMADGLRLAILCLLHTSVESLVWFGTPCSAWSVMCMVHSRRYESHSYLGDESRQFVRTGNKLMEVSAMLYFLTHLVSNIAILEQPKDSVMPKCSTMKLVLEFSFSHHIKTYGSAFETRSQKPWPIWSDDGSIARLIRRRPGIECEPLADHGHNGFFTGNRDAMRDSQVYPPAFGNAVFDMVMCRICQISLKHLEVSMESVKV